MKIAIRITCNDRTGMLRDLGEAISSLGILITASNSRSNMRSHRAIVRFTVFIRDNEELNALMTRLRDVAGVLDVTRDTKSR